MYTVCVGNFQERVGSARVRRRKKTKSVTRMRVLTVARSEHRRMRFGNARGMGRGAVIKMLRTKRGTLEAPFLSPANKFNDGYPFLFVPQPASLEIVGNAGAASTEPLKEIKAGGGGKKELQLVTSERALVATAILISPLHSIAPLACCLKARLVHATRRLETRGQRTDFSRFNHQMDISNEPSPQRRSMRVARLQPPRIK